jgi:hypothetical protein
MRVSSTDIAILFFKDHRHSLLAVSPNKAIDGKGNKFSCGINLILRAMNQMNSYKARAPLMQIKNQSSGAADGR